MASEVTSGDGPMIHSSSRRMGHCSTMMAAEMTAASAVDSPSNLALSLKSPLPHVCAVMPDVLMRRNPKFQYTRLNIIAPTATAPMNTLSPR